MKKRLLAGIMAGVMAASVLVTGCGGSKDVKDGTFTPTKTIQWMCTSSAGGGVVEVTVSGNREVTKVKIDPEAVDPDDVEMLEDLIMAATNEALRQIEEISAQSMSKITGGLGGMGGGFPF